MAAAPRLTILGSGQDGGVPQFGDTAPFSTARSASSVAIADRGHLVLLDASPDIRIQWRLLFESEAERPAGTPPVDAVYLTHGHMGHYAGLLHFGKEAAATHAVMCHGTEALLWFLQTNEPWARLFGDGHLVGAPLAMSPEPLWTGAVIAALPVPHRGEFSDTVAYSVRWQDPEWNVLYVPDIDTWDEWPEAHDVVAGHDVALLDATFYGEDELPDRPIAEVPHPLVKDTVDRFRDLTADRRLILTHINRTNPLNDHHSPEYRSVVAAGFEVAHDGMLLSP